MTTQFDAALKPEKLIPLRDIPALEWLPSRRAGARLALATVHRWAIRGVGGRRLRTVRVGGCLCTTESWLMDFFAAGAPGADTSPTYTPARRRRAAEKAKTELAAAGF